MAIEARNRALPDWFARIRTRQIALPRFQRFEAWDHAGVTQLFNTVLQDLPVGAALVLEIGNDQPFICRTLKGAPTVGERVTEHLLDGQQRLTALWRGLNNNYEGRTYFLYLNPDAETGLPFYVDSVGRWRNDGDSQMRPFWANSPKEQWIRRAVPLDLCAPELDTEQRFRVWANEAIPDQKERDRVSDTMVMVRQKFRSFNLPFLSLPVGTKPPVALDVFLKLNTTAQPLTTYDIVVAQVEASIGKSLHDLVADVRQACPTIAEYYPPEDLALYSSSLLQGRAPTNANYMSKDFGSQLVANWDRLLRGIKRTASFLEEERIFDASRLPTDVVIPVLVALWADAPQGLDAEGSARLLLRKYLWRAFFSDRYEKSTTSRSAADYNELKALVAGGQDAPAAMIFNEEEYPLPVAKELISAGWPKKKDRIGRAILAIALRNGGLDLADAGAASRANLPKREYHHLFPQAYLQGNGVGDEEINRALNCALVTWKTNRNISDKSPEKYLAERLDGTGVDQTEIEGRLRSHLIPYDELVAGDYMAFLQKRASMIHEQMQKLCGIAVHANGETEAAAAVAASN
ncbi:MAG TPA: DUF262 domain-containing protein [Verrucomicrobiae bacterium]|nr:DUF262 domain-containing protein [Verrucomicrobiae bacterium]